VYQTERSTAWWSGGKFRATINPFTKEPMTFEAKPASKVIKARPVQAAKDAVAEH
jgi:DNA-binding protein HU-beta